MTTKRFFFVFQKKNFFCKKVIKSKFYINYINLNNFRKLPFFYYLLNFLQFLLIQRKIFVLHLIILFFIITETLSLNNDYLNQQNFNLRLKRQKPSLQCEIENEICLRSNAQICRNNSCVSACSLKNMRECVCDSEEENYCYLCCGNAHNKCLPAHEHNIYKNNGERWERESCARCQKNRDKMEGLPCDDGDSQRSCLQGKCSKSICNTKNQGSFCDRKKEKICVNDVCENPCAKIASYLMICDCPAIDPDTGFASEDRCQLCCYDFSLKVPASRRCQSAFRKYNIFDTQKRPIWRVGLECAGGKYCNRFGICTNNATSRTSFFSSLKFPFVLFILCVAFVAILGFVFITA